MPQLNSVYEIRPGDGDEKRPYTNDWDVMTEFERRVAIANIPASTNPGEEVIPDNIIYVSPVRGIHEKNRINLVNNYGVQIKDPKLYNMIKKDLRYTTNAKGWVDTYKSGKFTTKIYRYFDKDITYDFSALTAKSSFWCY